MLDSALCFWHDPAHEDEAKEARRLGGQRRRRERIVSGAFDFERLDSIPKIRRLLDIAATDALSLDGSVAKTKRHDEAAIRKVKLWKPTGFPSGRVDMDAVERWIRLVCEGGCAAGHARSSKDSDCSLCSAGDLSIPKFNIVQVAYDPYQLEDISQRLKRESIVWCEAFDQGAERLVGDGLMYRLAMAGTLTHDGDADLREHIGNAKAKIQPDQESHMRIEKKRPAAKIDLAVAAAMAVKRSLALNI